MNPKWTSLLYPVATLIGIAIILIFVLASSGCSPQNRAENSSTAQEYVSDSASTESRQIFVCSHLGEERKPIDFSKYASVIWVEPVTQDIFSVYYINEGSASHTYHRAIAGPLKYAETNANASTTHSDDLICIGFESYKIRAEKAGYTFVYE